MFCKLKKGVALRGWQKLPYALWNIENGSVQFLSEADFKALSVCDGNCDIDAFYYPRFYKEAVQKAIEQGIAEECNQGEGLDPIQEYRIYNSRFMSMAHWSMTGKCNYRCRHCFMSAPDAKFGELTRQQCEYIINELADCGVFRISLTGGECLVRSDFMDLVDLMISNHIRIETIYSNGALVDEKLLDGLAERGIKPEFNMSFDGVGWHDWLRDIPGAEEDVVRAFKLCRDRGFPTGAELCIHQGNKHVLRESINLLAEVGCTHLKTNPVADTELWDRLSENRGISMEECLEVYLDYIPYFFKDGSPLTLMLGGFFWAKKGSRTHRVPTLKFNNTEEMGRQCICGHARNFMYIAADGKLLPCMALSSMDIQERFPSILDGLAKGLSDSYYMSFIDTRLEDYLKQNPECAACDKKYICGGGCRASALASSTDIYAKDLAACLIVKGGYEERIKEVVPQIEG